MTGIPLSRRSDRPLTDEELRCLGALRISGGAVRATDLVRRSRPAYPHLTTLETMGLTVSNRGWWRITDKGLEAMLATPIGRLRAADAYGR